MNDIVFADPIISEANAGFAGVYFGPRANPN
jgi:hypothetical protein